MTMKRYRPAVTTAHSPRKAEIVSEDKTAKYARDETGKTVCLVKGSLNGTPYPVGTKGYLQYIVSSSFGLDFFRLNE